jgi:hypothetical protein
MDLGNVAHWFLPIVGAVYSAGFLIVFWSSKTYGIDTVELFHGKYIHVGGLFSMAVIVVALPIFWLLGVQKTARETGRSKLAIIPGLIIYSAMLFTFYVVVAFAERDFFHQYAFRVLLNFAAPLAYSLVRLGLFKILIDPARKPTDIIVSASCAVFQVSWAWYTLHAEVEPGKSLWHYLGEIFPLKVAFFDLTNSEISGVYGFILLIILCMMYTALAGGNWDTASSTRWKLTVLLSVVPLDGMLFYLSILGFAYSAYSYIPSTKGGGGYVDAVPVRIMFRDSVTDANDMRQSMSTTNSKFIVLYESADSVFLASTEEAGGPRTWQKPGSSKPTVWEIRREAIHGIVYMNPTPTPSPMPKP